MKKILAIFDSDTEYGERFSNYLNRKEQIPFSMAFFTRKEALVEYASEHRVEMLLIHKEDLDAEIQKLPIGKIVFLTDIQDQALLQNEKAIYKYQSSENVFRELVSCYESMDMQVMQAIAMLRPIKIIGVYSPVGRCLKTSFALTLGQILAKCRPVLYLNFEEFSGFDHLFQCIFKTDLSDAMYCYKQGTLKNQLGAFISNWHNMDYIPPVQYPEDLQSFDPADYAGFVNEVVGGSHYDVIILDIGTSIGKALPLLMVSSKIYMPVLEDFFSVGKIDEFQSWIKLTGKMDILEKLVRMKLPYCNVQGKSQTYLEQLVWGELGDYVRTMISGEW